MSLKGIFAKNKLTNKSIAIIISVISLLVSLIGFYFSNLKPPKISFVTAPYIKQVVDDGSLNEAFFIPLTIVNRGAQPGTVLSFELNVANQTRGESRTYYGQYFAQENSQASLGDFFTPITLAGYSSASYTICFYPIGTVVGNLFSKEGVYEFEVVGKITNVKDQASIITENQFKITVDATMANIMDSQPDGEYIYPLVIEDFQ